MTKFWAANNPNSVTDESTLAFRNLDRLMSLNLEFCHNITDKTLQNLTEAGPPIRELYLSGCTNLSGHAISALIAKGGYVLTVADLSFLTQKEFNNETLKHVGNCLKLKKFNISGSSCITDEGFNHFIHDFTAQFPISPQIHKDINQAKHLRDLTDFRMSGFKGLGESMLYRIAQVAPNIEILDINGVSNLSEAIFGVCVKELPMLQVVTMNFTEHISQPFLDELKHQHPGTKFIRTVVKFSDPNDNGLRMPLPVVKKEKKKKKAPKKKK